MNVEGKVIVITGAARGLGQEYARYLGGLGARIVVGDLNDCALTVDLVKTEGGTAVGTKLDVANSSSAHDMARSWILAGRRQHRAQPPPPSRAA
jgi:NAD(P)-dependent dehydrogenase (short-subunit alcohol dehydrogenase family)